MRSDEITSETHCGIGSLREIPFMMEGSYSSNFYGIPTGTKDADLVVHLHSAEWAKKPAILPEGIEMKAR